MMGRTENNLWLGKTDELPKVCVIGGGGHAKVVIRALQESGYLVEAVYDDSPEKRGRRVAGVPVVGPVSQIAERGRIAAVIAVGDNAMRRDLASKLDLEWIIVVHPRAFVDKSAKIGQGTVICAGAVIQPEAVLGQHVIVNTGASIDHDCRIGDFVHLAPGAHLAGEVSVEEGALVGTGASVTPRRMIGAWSILGAGAVAIHDVPARTTAIGVPARPAQRTFPHQDNVLRSESLVVQPGGAPSYRSSDVQTNLGDASLPKSTKPHKRIYLSPPHMSGHERDMLLDAFDSNWIAPLGPHVEEFEREFAAKVGAAHAVAVSSGTAALHLALILAGVRPGDEVATSTLTFAASANAIRYVGADPVFIDSERDSWNMDPQLLAEEIEASALRGKPIKTVLAVDILGQCADWEPIVRLCKAHGILVIEDAAEALGATYRGRAAGTFGKIGCFSFNGNKIITTSGGGMLVTEDKDLADKARFLATQARDPAPHYEHSQIGYNYRMSNLLAAVGRGQLRVLDDRVERRRANFRFYQEALADLPGIEFMPELPLGRSTRWLTCILIDPDKFGATREDVRLALQAEDIESRPVWKPMHLQPVYRGFRARGGEVAEAIFRQGLCLPSGSNLTMDELERVTLTVRRCCRRTLQSTTIRRAA
jgi:sugar O-acyltransferase (sialic acid O-acetyltransferase NeuD family)